MTEHRRLHYAQVEFRPNPARPEEGRLPMGMIMEFTTPEYWVVGLAARVAFPPKALEGLDPLSRELLERRPSVIEIEIGRLLNKAEKPGDVLKLLAQYNQWSIHVTEPKIAQLDERTRKTD